MFFLTESSRNVFPSREEKMLRTDTSYRICIVCKPYSMFDGFISKSISPQRMNSLGECWPYVIWGILDLYQLLLSGCWDKFESGHIFLIKSNFANLYLPSLQGCGCHFHLECNSCYLSITSAPLSTTLHKQSDQNHYLSSPS